MDYLGTADYLTSPVSGKVEAWTHYNEWGLIVHNAVLKCGQRELDLVKRYATHDYDSVLELYYAKARFYDAHDRHFTAVDPILDPSQYDLREYVSNPIQIVQYLYVLDNPLLYNDPLGLIKNDRLNVIAQRIAMLGLVKGINPIFERYCLEILSTSAPLEGFHKIAQVVLYSAMWNSGQFIRNGNNGIKLEYRLIDPQTNKDKYADAVGMQESSMYVYEVKPAWHLRIPVTPQRTDVHAMAIDQLKGYVKLACGQRNGCNGTFKAYRGFELNIPKVVIYDDRTIQIFMTFTQENGLVGYKVGIEYKTRFKEKEHVRQELSIEEAINLTKPIIKNYRLGIETDAQVQMTKAIGVGVATVYAVSAMTTVGGLIVIPAVGGVTVSASYTIADNSTAIYASQLAVDASMDTTETVTALIGILEDGSCVQILVDFLNNLPVFVH